MKKHKGILIALIYVVLIQLCYLSVATCTTASQVIDNSTMFRHDLNHSGYVAGIASTNSSKILWNSTMGDSVSSSPAVINGYVYIGSLDGYIYRLNAANGQQVWSYHTKGQVRSSPAVDNDRLVVGSDDGWIYCLNANTGLLIWNFKVGGYARSSPAIVGGYVYVGSGTHDLYCFNVSDGATIWRFNTKERVDSSPAVSGGVVYVATDDFYVYAINASTGQEIWHKLTQSSKSSPCLSNGYLYIGCYNGSVYGLNATTGQKIWQFQTQDTVDSSPATAYGCVYIGSDDNNLYCLNATNGQKIWQSSTGYWIISSPEVSGGNVYVGSEDNGIYCFNAYTGAQQWSYLTGSYVDSSPTVNNGTLYVGSFDGNVYAFTLCNATTSTLPPKVANPALLSTIAFEITAAAIGITVIISALCLAIYTRREDCESRKVEPSALQESWLSKHVEGVCLLALLAFSTLFVINLGTGTLWAADEQTYSQWAFHMSKTGDYLTPWAFGGSGIWIAKPPLLIWLMALSYQVLGVSNFTARVWTPLFGALSLILVFYLGKKIFNRNVGFAAAIVLGTFVTFFKFAKAAMTDIPLVCFMLASIYFLLLSEKPQHCKLYGALAGVFFGLALMTKQVVALFIPVIIIIYWVATKKSPRFLLTKRFALFVGIGLLIFAPWVILMYASFGSDFTQWFVVYTGVMRTVSPLEGHTGSPLFYINYIVSNENLLWVALLPFAVGLCIFNVVKKWSRPDGLILIWIFLVLLVFSVAQTKISWYILPAYPAFALAIASLLYAVSNRLNLQRFLDTAKVKLESRKRRK